jgi:hypothetical protein
MTTGEQYQGPERRQGQLELVAVAMGLDNLTKAIETNLSEERLQGIVSFEQKRGRNRLILAMVMPLTVAILVSFFGLAQAHSNHTQGARTQKIATDAAHVATYVDHCLVHPDQATAGECGNSVATGQQSATVIALFCFLELPQGERTDKTATECFTKAAAQAKASSAAATTTTTTTRKG